MKNTEVKLEIYQWKVEFGMSFKNPDRYKKKKNIVKKVTFAPKLKKVVKEKKPKEKS